MYLYIFLIQIIINICVEAEVNTILYYYCYDIYTPNVSVMRVVSLYTINKVIRTLNMKKTVDLWI